MGTAHEEYLKEIADLHDVHDPPRVEMVAEVGPSEQLERIVLCMQDAGWADVKIESGGLRYPWDPDDPEQREAIGLALYTCYARYPIKAELLRPSKGVYRRLYDYFRDELEPTSPTS